MKKVAISILVLLMPAYAQSSDLTTTKSNSVNVASSSTIELSYFGQIPPGSTPELFAPGILSSYGRSVGAISFSPDLDEIYFEARRKNEKFAIYFSKLEGNKWTPIEKAAFIKGKEYEEVQPFVSPDGKYLFFNRSINSPDNTDIFWVDAQVIETLRPKP